MVDFLRRERVDVVVTCDLERVEMVSGYALSALYRFQVLTSIFTDQEAIDSAARGLNVKYYGAGTYGFYGYVFADLGEGYEYVHT